MDCLRKHFSPHLETSLPRAFERAIYGNPRSSKETLQEYLIRAERAFFLLSKEGVTMGDEAVGYILYRQASLSESQELRFGAWSQGKYDKGTVVKRLRKLDKAVSDAKGKSAHYLMEDDDTAADEEAGYDDYDTVEGYLLEGLPR